MAGRRGQHGAGAEYVAALRLALQTLAEPQHRRAGAVEMRSLLDLGRGHACRGLAPRRVASGDLGRDLGPADHVGGDEAVVDEAIAPHDVQHREGERGVAAGEELQVQIGVFGGRMAHRVDDDDLARCLLEPVLVLMRRRRRRIGAPDNNAGGVLRRPWIETDRRGAEHIAERNMARVVADRIGIDLGRAQAIEEAIGEVAGDQRAGAGVVGVDDRLGAGVGGDRAEPLGDLADRRVPRDRFELAAALGAVAAQWHGQPGRGIAEHAVVGERAFAAERAATDRMLGIAEHFGDFAAALDDDDAAGVVAIARAGRANVFPFARHGVSTPDLFLWS